MTSNAFPPGWDRKRVHRVLEHYENQTDEQTIAEDEAAFTDHPETIISVPVNLIPTVRELIGKQQSIED